MNDTFIRLRIVEGLVAQANACPMGSAAKISYLTEALELTAGPCGAALAGLEDAQIEASLLLDDALEQRDAYEVAQRLPSLREAL